MSQWPLIKSIDDTLWHVMDVTPVDESGRDEYGQPIYAPGTIIFNVPCRYREAGSRDFDFAQTAGLTKIDYVVTLGMDVEIVPRMKLGNFRNRATDVSFDLPTLLVQHVDDRRLMINKKFQLVFCEVTK